MVQAQRYRLTAEEVTRQIGNLSARHPDVFEDDELRTIAIESETEVHEFLTAVVKRLDEIEMMQIGLAQRISELVARKERLARRIEGLRSLILAVMEIAVLRKLELSIATLVIRQNGPKLLIADHRLIPEGYHKVAVEIDKAKVKRALQDGVVINGATLSNGGESLQVRIK